MSRAWNSALKLAICLITFPELCGRMGEIFCHWVLKVPEHLAWRVSSRCIETINGKTPPSNSSYRNSLSFFSLSLPFFLSLLRGMLRWASWFFDLLRISLSVCLSVCLSLSVCSVWANWDFHLLRRLLWLPTSDSLVVYHLTSVHKQIKTYCWGNLYYFIWWVTE